MADVEIEYRSSIIASLTGSGTKTLQTAGKYCDDDIIIDYTAPSGSGTLPMIGAAIWGTVASASWTTIGLGVLSEPYYSNDLFAYDPSTGTFTCKSPGTYKIVACSRGGYNNSGTARYAHFRVLLNNTAIINVDTNQSGNSGYTTNTSQTLAINDEIIFQGKTNTGTNTGDYTMIIIKTA